ncbi:MAG: glycerol-3-phosphate dehydrogenase/oxidase [Actinomycetota bacterium]
MHSSSLSPAQRSEALDRMATQRLDVLIIGGGVTGAGCALDAAARGLSVGLVEQRDYASGTSSRSSKLIHGGLRYLEQFNFALVFEALGERGLLLEELCPHLVRPVSFLYPLKHKYWERPYIGTGIALYDLLAGIKGNPLPRHRHLGRKGVAQRFPSVRPDVIEGGVIYWDAQVDDARHTMSIARTAARFGAWLAPSTRVVGLVKDGDRVVGAEVDDLEGGRRLTIQADQVINATGVWTDSIQDFAGTGNIRVNASKGIHLVVPRDRIQADTGVILRTEKSVLFIIPWGDHWLIGTTDTEWELDLAHPAASRSDIDYLLERVNGVLKDPLTHDDIVGVFAGLRPLLSGESDDTSKLSREHAVSQALPGLITIAGGKYTTYRVMAEDAVDAAVANLGRTVPPSPTANTPLVGADGYQALWNARQRIARRAGQSVETIEHLLGRYGSMIDEVLELIDEQGDLGRPLGTGTGHLRAEVVYACAHEGALHLDDVLTRRTRISIESAQRGLDVAEEVAELMAGVLGWDSGTVERELAHYRARVEAELESQRMPDDRTADAARLGAPDVRFAPQQG